MNSRAIEIFRAAARFRNDHPAWSILTCVELANKLWDASWKYEEERMKEATIKTAQELSDRQRK